MFQTRVSIEGYDEVYISNDKTRKVSVTAKVEFQGMKKLYFPYHYKLSSLHYFHY